MFAARERREGGEEEEEEEKGLCSLLGVKASASQFAWAACYMLPYGALDTLVGWIC